MAHLPSLPRGIALLRVETPFGRVMVCSSALTSEEEAAARIAAAQMIRCGAFAVMLSMIDIAALLQDAA